MPIGGYDGHVGLIVTRWISVHVQDSPSSFFELPEQIRGALVLTIGLEHEEPFAGVLRELPFLAVGTGVIAPARKAQVSFPECKSMCGSFCQSS